ncbi:MAG: hypothetical protein ACLS9A_06545 [Clostridia bacterium]
MVIDYLKIYTFLSKEEIEEPEKKHKEHPELREAHKALAREIITFLHGKKNLKEQFLWQTTYFITNFKIYLKRY